ncbi:hypothetical protein POF45_00380 [Pseudomonas sp. 681]|uniref:Uncharacterized protein n=1 Tax=Pseudomonas fungipugnans TaxID=3024217 RepID=A0ABT6QHZ5_9PSED|nr:hypothetical protein [Pseudomonas sp. 681]MDI2589889.1 hypothetical protein [Pseudomonas sp. 681]
MADNIGFTRFTVEVLNNNFSLYANNRQQLSVRVTYTKTVNGIHTPLNDDELRSLQLVERSGTSIPVNWTSERNRGIFDEGMWSRSLVDSPDSFAEDHAEPNNPTEEASSIQSVTIFLRARLPAQSRAFRATVDITGLRRFYSDEDVGTDVGSRFTSWIEATSIPSYTLRATDLHHFTELGHSSGSGSHTRETFIFYWQLPSPLRILVELTLTGGSWRPPGLLMIGDSGRRLMFRIGHDVQRLSVGEIWRFPYFNNQNVQLRNGVHSMRALMSYNRSHPARNWDRFNNSIRITDSFGCEHTFVFAQVDNNNISITGG